MSILFVRLFKTMESIYLVLRCFLWLVSPVGISEIPAHFVFKGRIAENGLENQFVRAIGIDEELHDAPIADDEISGKGAGIVRHPKSIFLRIRPLGNNQKEYSCVYSVLSRDFKTLLYFCDRLTEYNLTSALSPPMLLAKLFLHFDSPTRKS